LLRNGVDQLTFIKNLTQTSWHDTKVTIRKWNKKTVEQVIKSVKQSQNREIINPAFILIKS